MSTPSFDVPFTGPIDRILSRAAGEAAASGVKFSGNSQGGRIENSDFCMTYVIHDRIITFTIEDKPFYVPVSLIESKVKEWLT